ncbi:hypothetical protein, partial [Pseudovibrio sp. W74]|uniref:hypothetical protein n=1 Tax=Pseudovibrio sp. W74 TaxID=1735584 RepID=UPI0019D36046
MSQSLLYLVQLALVSCLVMYGLSCEKSDKTYPPALNPAYSQCCAHVFGQLVDRPSVRRGLGGAT